MQDESSDVFDELSEEDVVLPFRPEVRCFPNKRGEVTIGVMDDRASFDHVSVPVEALRLLAARLVRLADIEDAPTEQGN